MSTQDLGALFDSILTPAGSLATAPTLVLGVGVLLFLVCDIVRALQPARDFVVGASLALAAVFELRILSLATPPGIVLGGTHERGVWDLAVSRAATERILAGHVRLFGAA